MKSVNEGDLLGDNFRISLFNIFGKSDQFGGCLTPLLDEMERLGRSFDVFVKLSDFGSGVVFRESFILET